jgi:hypothetical protein
MHHPPDLVLGEYLRVPASTLLLVYSLFPKKIIWICWAPSGFLVFQPLWQVSRPPTQFFSSARSSAGPSAITRPQFIRPELFPSALPPGQSVLVFTPVSLSLLWILRLHCAKMPRGKRSKPQSHLTLIQPPHGILGTPELLWLQWKIFSLPL